MNVKMEISGRFLFCRIAIPDCVVYAFMLVGFPAPNPFLGDTITSY